MIATNNTPGHQTVAFAIPQSEWELQFVYPGRAVLRTTVGFYFRSFDEVTIDGTTQTAFTGDTNPDGCEVSIYGATFYLNGDNSEILGFDSIALQVTGDNAHVHGMTGTTNITLFDSHNSLIEGNVGGTIKVDRSNDTVIVGNTVRRVRVQGFVSEFGTGPAFNTRIGGPTLAERNYITGYGTRNGEGYPNGSTIEVFDSTGTVIENNWIGTTPDGLARGNDASTQGIGFYGVNNNTLIKNNRIAGILGVGTGPHAAGLLFGSAIDIYGTGSGVTIQGNTIGLDANDEPSLGSVTGIIVRDYLGNPVSDILIGGPNPEDANVIAGHLINGITVNHPTTGVTISGNSIYGNDDLGIDLTPVGNPIGVTANDALDNDAGGNNLQNYPVIVSAVRNAVQAQVGATLNSVPNDDYQIEFLLNSQCSASGFGEGELFLGAMVVSTDGAGNASIDATLPIDGVFDGNVVTATATRLATGDTSEFSACFDADVMTIVVGDFDGSGAPGMSDLPYMLDVLLGSSTNPGDYAIGDMDGNGVVDGRDIGLFTRAVTS